MPKETKKKGAGAPKRFLAVRGEVLVLEREGHKALVRYEGTENDGRTLRLTVLRTGEALVLRPPQENEITLLQRRGSLLDMLRQETEHWRDDLFPWGAGRTTAGRALHALRSLWTHAVEVAAMCGESPPATSPTLEALEAEVEAEGVGKAIPLGRFEEMARRIIEEAVGEV